jgi:hypothetical protein
MVNYFYKWTPLVVVGAVVLLALPWLGLIALTVAALATLAALSALASALVAVPIAFGRALGHRWHAHSAAPVPSPALWLAERRRASRA